MFGVFKSKALEARVSVLEEEIKKALDSKKEVMEASSEVIALQEKVQQSLEKQLKAAQRMVKNLSSQNRKLIRVNNTTERGVVGSGKLSNENFTPAKVSKRSRIEVIKKVATKGTSKQVKVLGEITPRGTDLSKMPYQDKLATIEELLGVDLDITEAGGIFVKGLNIPIKVMHNYPSTGRFYTRITKDSYILVADKVTNKFYLTFLPKSKASGTGTYSFNEGSTQLASIRANHAKALQVLKDKLK